MVARLSEPRQKPSRLGEPSYSGYNMPMKIEWNLFDSQADSIVTKRNMPHIDMTSHLTFVTFRMADSMPRDVVQRWHSEIDSWLKENGLAGRAVEEILNSIDVDDKLKNELRQFKNRRWHGYLDECYGACVLRHPQARSFVEDSLLHFEGKRYELERFIVMPNHVHLMIQTRPGFQLRKQLTQIMRFSGRKVNSHLKRCGDCWQSEPFDHVVRSAAQFEYLQRYIADNPKKASLSPDEYTLWERS